MKRHLQSCVEQDWGGVYFCLREDLKKNLSEGLLFTKEQPFQMDQDQEQLWKPLMPGILDLM